VSAVYKIGTFIALLFKHLCISKQCARHKSKQEHFESNKYKNSLPALFSKDIFIFATAYCHQSFLVFETTTLHPIGI
jgi:hypothetical protein